MIGPIDFGRIEVALASTRGWLELVATLLCIVAAWAIVRRVAAHRKRMGYEVLLPGVVRLGFPLLKGGKQHG